MKQSLLMATPQQLYQEAHNHQNPKKITKEKRVLQASIGNYGYNPRRFIPNPVLTTFPGRKYVDRLGEQLRKSLQPVQILGNMKTGGYRGVGVVGGWKELARTTLGSAADSISVSSLANKRYYMILASILPSGNVNDGYRLNADSGTNYASRGTANGAADTTVTSGTIAGGNAGSAYTTPLFHVGRFANLSTKEKLHILDEVAQRTAGAGNAPERQEKVAKWANTADAINAIALTNTDTGDFNTNSELVVLGWDPADTHTNNFWEQLASVTLGSAGDNLSSGTITAKKYLYFEAFLIASSTISQRITFNNDTGSNYALRRSLNGGADATSVSRANIYGFDDTNDAGSDNRFLSGYIINVSAQEKLLMMESVRFVTAGAGTAPSRAETVGKWANTSAQITEIDIDNPSAGSYDVGSVINVWGSD